MEDGGPTKRTAVETFECYVDAFNRADVLAVVGLYAERTEVLNPFSPDPLTTPAAVEAFVAPMFAAYTDMRAEPDAVVAEGPLLAARLTIRARHTGELPGPSGPVAATGRIVTLRTAEFLRVDTAGLIVEHERIFDTAAVLRQLHPGG
jgi:predicted ester cyclase